MDSSVAVKTAPERPYDDSLWEHWSMYDNMPYIWNPDLNIERTFKYVSGNLIKGYRCNIVETYEIRHE